MNINMNIKSNNSNTIYKMKILLLYSILYICNSIYIYMIYI